MKTNYVLIDFENVQPKDVALLQGGNFKVNVFLGPEQKAIPTWFATKLQALGNSAEYTTIESPGDDALDFHIAYYLGALSSQDKSAFFHIISKDTGYDPLIKHLTKNSVFVRRSERIVDIRAVQIIVALTDLTSRKTAKPQTVKTLLGTLNQAFKNELSPSQLSDLVTSLGKYGVKVDGTKVSYAQFEQEYARPNEKLTPALA